MTWTLVEPDVYLIAACLPTYRPLLLHVLEKLKIGYALTTAKSGYRSKHSDHSNLTAQPIKPKQPSSQENRFSGFRRVSSDVDSLEEMGYGEGTRLGHLGSGDLDEAKKRQTTFSPAPLNQIVVQNEYDVCVEPKTPVRE